MPDDHEKLRLAMDELLHLQHWASATFTAEVARAYLSATRRVQVSLSRTCLDLGLPAPLAPAARMTLGWRAAITTARREHLEELAARVLGVAERLRLEYHRLGRESRRRPKERVRDAIGCLYVDVLAPIWAEFPELEPKEMRDP